MAVNLVIAIYVAITSVGLCTLVLYMFNYFKGLKRYTVIEASCKLHSLTNYRNYSLSPSLMGVTRPVRQSLPLIQRCQMLWTARVTFPNPDLMLYPGPTLCLLSIQ